VHALLKRFLLLALALTIVAAPIAEASAAPGPVAGVAKKKGKKCKGKKKKKGTALSAKKKKGKKCKKGAGGLPGLPGKPLNPDPPNPPPPPVTLTLQSMSLEENPVLAGTAGEGQVTLSAPAPTNGKAVTLSSGVPSRASVPDSVHVAAGQTTATFPITTTAGPNDSIVLTAALGTSTRNATLDIVEEESLNSLELAYQCYPGDDLEDVGGNVVSLDVRAPSDIVVDLDSSDPFTIDVPSTVTVLEGAFNGGFNVDTLQMTTTPVTVTATYDDDVFTDEATVRDETSPDPVASELALQPDSVVVGDPSTGTVSLDCEAPAGGITVNLSSNNAGASVPASVVVQEGDLSANFPITTDVNATPGTAVIRAWTVPGVPPPDEVQADLTLRAIGS
jgi:trimeric autotransporter adhesin